MRRSGFICAYRSLLDHPLITQLSPEWLKLFLVILLSVNWKPGKWWNGTAEIEVSVGSMITSREKLSKIANISIAQVRGGLDYLKASSIVTIKTTNKYSILTVCNWNIYQFIDDAGRQQGNLHEGRLTTIEQPANNQLAATIEQSNNSTREQGETRIALPPLPFLKQRAEISFEVSDAFERIYRRHPVKTQRTLAEQSYAKHFSEGRFTLEDFDRIHNAWCASERWQWKAGARAPRLAEWIDDLGYQYEPPREKTLAETLMEDAG